MAESVEKIVRKTRYQVVIIETVSAHSTREAATRALRKLPSRKRGLALVIEVPVTVVTQESTVTMKVAATKKGKKS